MFFHGMTSDSQFYPTVGRMFRVNAPKRGIPNQLMSVVGLTVSLLDIPTELVQYQIQFGADLHLEKVLKNFVDLRPPQVLTPSDTSNPPNPRYTVEADNTYLPDLNNVQVDMTQVKPGYAVVKVLDNYYGPIEVRRIDNNWGMGVTSDLLALTQGPEFTLQRLQYDQTWYLRPVQGGKTSRRSKVIRIMWPQRPSPPLYVSSSVIQGTGPNAVSATIAASGMVVNTSGALVYTYTPQAYGYVHSLTIGGNTHSFTDTGGYGAGQIAEVIASISSRDPNCRVVWNGDPITDPYNQTVTITPFYTNVAIPVSGSDGNVTTSLSNGEVVSTFSSSATNTISSLAIQFNYNGDMRNIYGFELRAGDNKTVLYQRPAASPSDMLVDLTQTPFHWLDEELSTDYTFYAYFFNAQWDYSDPTVVSLNQTTGGERSPFPWSPGYALPLAGDVFPDIASFGIRPIYDSNADTTGRTSVAIRGFTPPNQMTEHTGPPEIQATTSAGGAIPSGKYYASVFAIDKTAASGVSALGPVVAVDAPNNAKIEVTVDWESTSSGGVLCVSDVGAYGPWYQQMYMSASEANATLTAFSKLGKGAPDPVFSLFGVPWMQIVHGGVWAQQVQGVTGNQILIAGSGMVANQWADYVVSLLAKYSPSGDVPIMNMPVYNSTASRSYGRLLPLGVSGFMLGIGPNASGNVFPGLQTLLSIGDLLVMRGKYTFTDTSFTDPNVANPYFPDGATGVEAGHVAVVVSGPDRGDIQTIAGVGLDGDGHSTIFKLASKWVITPNDGDLVIICDPSVSPEWPSAPVSVADNTASGVIVQPTIQNMAGETWLFMVRTKDVNGSNGPDSLVPMREIYMFGTPGAFIVRPSTY